jgi:hypothetical protein
LAGRDNYFRPIILISIGNLEKKKRSEKQIDDFIEALTFIFRTTREYMMLPYHIENWIVMIDINNKGVLNFPLSVLPPPCLFMLLMLPINEPGGSV